MSIENDRWFKLKVDSWILHSNNESMGFHRKYSVRVHADGKPWYEKDYLWSQVSESLAKGTKYTPEEVEEFLKHRVAMAKTEALLDGR